MLPKVDVLTFPVTIPSTKKTVICRPYSVKEEKILLMANEADEASREAIMTQAIHTLIENCTLGSVSAAKHPWFDLEYLLVQLRAKSVGSEATITFSCQKPNDQGGICGTPVPLTINLEEVKIEVGAGHTNKIELRQGIGVVLRYPRLEDLTKYFPAHPTGSFLLTEHAFDFIVNSIEAVYTSTEFYDAGDQTPEALTEFLEQFKVNEFEKIYTFFHTLPRLEHTLQFKCPKCENEGPITLRGIRDFLALSSVMTV